MPVNPAGAAFSCFPAGKYLVLCSQSLALVPPQVLRRIGFHTTMALVLLGSSFLAAPWTHASDWQEPIQCTTAVVGGGWAGVYSAWRLALDAAAADASSVCLFEARQAVGGRTYSVDVDGLTIDIGAYRFGMSMHLPADLIVNHFKLKTVCYEPSCSPDAEMNATLYRIVDADGHNAGYATPVRAMLREALGRGVRVFYRHELTGIYDGGGDALAEGGASLLHFAGGGGVVRASAVLLNLPRQAVERLDPASVVFDRGPSVRAKLATTILTNCTPCQAGPVAEAHEDVKVYAIYDHPWWVSKLGLAEGTFASVDADPPLVGRYHDGPIRRRGKDAPGPAALEAVYTFTLEHPQVKWYLPFVRNLAGEPLTVTTDPALLLPLHTRLMDYHRAAFAARGCNATAPPPLRREKVP